MAHSLSAQKRVRQNLKRRLRNKQIKSFVKSRVKKVRTLIATYKPSSDLPDSKAGLPADQAEDNASKQRGLPNLQVELNNAYKALDKAVSSGIIHKNKAARLKSRLTLAVNRVCQ